MNNSTSPQAVKRMQPRQEEKTRKMRRGITAAVNISFTFHDDLDGYDDGDDDETTIMMMTMRRGIMISTRMMMMISTKMMMVMISPLNSMMNMMISTKGTQK